MIKRIALGLGGLILAMVATMALMPDSKDPGDTDVLDLSASPVPPAENSHSDYLKLAESLTLTKEEEAQVRQCAEDSACHPRPLDGLISRQAQALRHFDAFRGKRFEPPEWVDPAKLTVQTPIPKLAPVSLAQSLALLQSRSLREKGRPAEALEAALRIAEAGQSFQSSAGSIMVYMMGSQMKLRGLKAVRDAVEAGSVPPNNYMEALPRVRPLHNNREALKRALRLEYAISAHLIDSLKKEDRSPTQDETKVPGWVARLFFKPNQTRIMLSDDFRKAIQEVDQPCPPVAPPASPPRPWWKNPAILTGNLVGVILQAVGQPSWEKLHRRRCEENFWVGATQIALAAGAFALQNRQPPAEIGQLSPRYLPHTPLDPFTGQPLSYSPQTGEVASPGVDSKGKPLSVRIRF